MLSLWYFYIVTKLELMPSNLANFFAQQVQLLDTLNLLNFIYTEYVDI